MVHSENKENGQKEAKIRRCEESVDDDVQGTHERTITHEEKMDSSFPGAMETQSPTHTSHDVEMNTGKGSVRQSGHISSGATYLNL